MQTDLNVPPIYDGLREVDPSEAGRVVSSVELAASDSPIFFLDLKNQNISFLPEKSRPVQTDPGLPLSTLPFWQLPHHALSLFSGAEGFLTSAQLLQCRAHNPP